MLYIAYSRWAPLPRFQLQASCFVHGQWKVQDKHTHTHSTHNCQVTLVTQAHTNLQLKKSSGLPRLKTSTIEVLQCTPELEVGITKFLHRSVHEPTTSQETLTLHSSMKPVPRKLFAPPLNSWNQSVEINMGHQRLLACKQAISPQPSAARRTSTNIKSSTNTLMTTPIFGKKNSGEPSLQLMSSKRKLLLQEESDIHLNTSISTAGCGCTNGTKISDQQQQQQRFG